MFERFIRLAKARKALRDRCYEDALALAADPMIRADRRAGDIRSIAAEQLLARAKRHLAAGDVAVARAEVVRVRGILPSPEADALAKAVDAAAATDQAAVDLARRTLAEVRRLLDRGETAAAGALLATVASSHLLLERDQLERLSVERRRQAVAACEAAHAALDAGDVAAALQGHGRAQALDRDAPATARLASAVLAAAAARVQAELRVELDRGHVAAGLERYRVALRELPDLAAATPMGSVRNELLAAVGEALRGADSVDAVLPLALAVIATDFAEDPVVGPLAAAIAQAKERAGRGEAAAAAAVLRSAASAAGAAGLADAADSIASGAEATDARIQAIHRHIDQGDLDAARAALLELLAVEPMHEAARRELQLVEAGVAEIEQRLEGVRSAARAGRLREACTLALALRGSPRVAEEAQRLVAEIRGRMALVDRGLDEVRVALHGRLAAGVEGVRHLLRRLEELAKVQVDHTELPTVLAAVGAEIEALGLCDAAAKAIERHALDEVAGVVLQLVPLREKLIARDRMEARTCALADRLRALGDAALAAGRLADADRSADVLDGLRAIRSEFADRAAAIRAAATSRRGECEAAVAAANDALARRDLAEAERCTELAQSRWRESPDARALANQLADLRRQTEVLGRVAALTEEGDLLGARQKLAAMPPTQALLRTRIYDMKQNLARAQGLEGAFLLRVDEGGEYLVLRGESVSIGNVRQSRADLPVLANLAGVHASIRRSMSFHGGMQDTVVAEEGEVRVGGAVVTQRPLAPGDRVQLGPSFTFAYQRPSSRSLTAAVTLQGGFQVAGTDRVLLMKDRGKDGRILVGNSADVHVRVAAATAEVEVFATNTGQIRVRCDGGGTIDGVPFRGEHPVAAGQVVAAAGASFVLLPWRPAV